MMFELIPLAWMSAYLTYMSILDLKKGEIPNQTFKECFLGLVGLTVLFSFPNIIPSFFWGGVAFSIGWVLYKLNIWGGADALAIGLVAFSITPISGLLSTGVIPLPFSFVINVFVLASFYIAIYKIFTGFKGPYVRFVPCILAALIFTLIFGDVFTFIKFILTKNI